MGPPRPCKKPYSLGKAETGQSININFDPLTREFLFSDNDGLLLGRRKVKGLEQERIMGAAPICLPKGFQLQLPFDSISELELQLYETT